MAELELHVKRPIYTKEGKLLGILEIKIWRVPKDRCYPEGYKYSLVFARYDEESGAYDGEFLRYDNHRCEGHHRHVRGERFPYRFRGIDELLDDFEAELRKLLEEVSYEG